MAFGAVIGQTFTGGVKNNRLVIGTSTAGWLQADCDYLCDGTNDEQEFNTAIQFLNTYNGGEIVVLDGAYNISAAIAISIPNVSLIGNGNATILKNLSTTTNLINVTASDFHIANMSLEGTTQQSCINISAAGSNVVVESVAFSGADNSIYTKGSSGQFIGNQFVNNDNGICLVSDNNIVNANVFDNCSIFAVYIEGNGNIISNNTFTNCYTAVYAVYSETTSSGANIVNNVMIDNNTGIYANSLVNSTITGNTIYRGSGTSENYTSSQYTIQMSGCNNCMVTNNLIPGKDIVVSFPNTNTMLFMNKWDASTSPLPIASTSQQGLVQLSTNPGSTSTSTVPTSSALNQVYTLAQRTDGLTANRVMISNGSGDLAVSAVTTTELGYIDGVTSNVQTQLNAKQKKITYGTGNPSGGSTGDVYIQY